MKGLRLNRSKSRKVKPPGGGSRRTQQLPSGEILTSHDRPAPVTQQDPVVFRNQTYGNVLVRLHATPTEMLAEDWQTLKQVKKEETNIICSLRNSGRAHNGSFSSLFTSVKASQKESTCVSQGRVNGLDHCKQKTALGTVPRYPDLLPMLKFSRLPLRRGLLTVCCKLRAILRTVGAENSS